MAAQQVTSGRRGRPREFDLDEAVRDAVEVFQTHGYEGASLVHLQEGTGLTKGSLYKAFTDKKTLFLLALDRYTSENTASLRDSLASGAPKEAVRSALVAIARTSALVSGERGCLVVGSTTEMAAKDKDIKDRIKRTFARMEGYLREAIVRGQGAGEITSRNSPKSLSRFLLCLIEGLGVLGKTGRTEKEMLEIVDVAMTALD
jgi:TetR/AcrR family transcriptional repressor of nem operon